MPRDVVFTPRAAAPPATYSQAVKAAGLVFVSGTAPTDPATGQIVEGGVREQVAQCLRNISAILEAAGSSLDRAVSATLIIADEDDFAATNVQGAVIANSGHWVMEENPKDTVAAVTGFLR